MGCLPGFSGRFDDGTLDIPDASADELADLSILGARLQREKLKIQEDAKALRQPFEIVSLCIIHVSIHGVLLYSIRGLFLCNN